MVLNKIIHMKKIIMNESKLIENLKMLAKIRGGLSVSDISRKTKIPQPTLHHIFEGKTKTPRSETLKALAEFFSISVGQLIGSIPFNPIKHDLPADTLLSKVPLLNWDYLMGWRGEKIKDEYFKPVFIDKNVGENGFAVTLPDSRLDPLFQENAILIFSGEKNPKDRDFVLAYVEKFDALVFNRFFVENKIPYVKHDKANGDAQLIRLTSPLDKVIGVLVEARQEF